MQIAHQNGWVIFDGFVYRRHIRYVLPEAGERRINYGISRRHFFNLKGAASAPNPPAAQMLFAMMAAR